MTEKGNLKSFGIYDLTVLKEANRERLAVGIKPAYRSRPQYKKVLDSAFANGKKLDHPNILKYEGLQETGDQGPCLLTEWEECRPLTDYAAETHTEDEKKSIVTQIAEALGYMHQRGLIHGALTPSVIFVTTKGDTVKILNFRQRYADGLKQPAESLRFIAPEAKDGTVTLDARADIFSLGQVVRLLDMPHSYQSVINGCCSFGRSERYNDIDDFLAAFNHQKRARNDNHKEAAEDLQRAMGPNRAALGIVALIVVLVLVTAVWIFRQQSQKGDDGTPQITEQMDTTAAGNTSSATTTGNGDAATTAFQGSNEVYLNELMPQVKADLDNIYAKAKGKKTLKRKVTRYYRGLRKVLTNKGMTDAQLQAFDKAFAEYNGQKTAELTDQQR